MHLDLETLETTFDLVAQRGEELMDIFYAPLFAAAPSVTPLFNGIAVNPVPTTPRASSIA